MPLEQSLALALANPRAGLIELDRIDQEESLIEFLMAGWKYIDPVPYVHGWHLEAIAEHLEAVTYGDIRRLIINVPPRHSKSSIVSVAWPVWTWAQGEIGPLSGPQVQFLSSSYAQQLSTRDALKSRRLMQSPWFQERWGDRFALTGDQNAKMRYENDKGGYRLATSVGGGLTGEGGSIILVDDPLNAQEAVSEATRLAMVEWWDQAMSTRLNDPKTGAYVVIMQRLHEEDLTGHILAGNHGDWTHLCLPARYEPDRHCVTVLGLDDDGDEVLWQDPRTEPGEILAPSRFDDAALRSLEKSLGPYGSAGQLQQRPQPAGGGIIRREWWQYWERPPEGTAAHQRFMERFPSTRFNHAKFPPCEYVIGSLDGAYTEKEENDYSAFTVWGVFRDAFDMPRIMMMNAWRDRLPLHELVEKSAATCRKFKVDRLLVEAKATGISVAQELQRLYGSEGWGVQLVTPKGDKTARVYSVQPMFADEMIYCPDREWADMVITEFESFPKGAHDDLVDSATQALKHIRDIGLAAHGAEISDDLGDPNDYRRGLPAKPLYPA